MTDKELADKAANWWFERIKSGPNIRQVLSDNTPGQIALMEMVQGEYKKPEDKFEALRVKLSELLVEKFRYGQNVGGFDLSVDYNPRGLLLTAATSPEVGLDPWNNMNWPWKTAMQITNGAIRVKSGYAAGWESVP